MKHIQTFESFVYSLNEAESFKEGDFVKWTTPQTGNQISFGVVTKVRSKSFDAKVIATGGKGDEQPSRGLALGLGGPVIWKKGITADQLRREIENADETSNVASNIRFEKASLWTINESFLSEGNQSMGNLAKKMTTPGITGVGEWDTFIDAVKKEKDNGEDLPKEWYNALKTLKIKPEEAVVIFFDAVGSQKDVEYKANRLNLKYVVVEDTNDGGSGGIVFSAKQ